LVDFTTALIWPRADSISNAIHWERLEPPTIAEAHSLLIGIGRDDSQ
jgi:hypothetical protein